jgi:L,D-transpeptidase YbiS
VRKIKIDSRLQKAFLWEDGRLLKSYPISTAAKGLGCEANSYCTPIGKLRVAAKIGHGLPVGAILKSRIPTGDVCRVGDQAEEDLVLTRVLWLEGVEPANANTKDRFIYLHGTNQESKLGQPVSHGCIRFSNQDILEVFELLDEGSEVEIS